MKYIFLLPFFGLFYLVNGDYYSAISGLETLLNVEKYLIENLEYYMQAVQYKNSFLKHYIAYVEQEHEKIKENSVDYFGNPIKAWHAIKRVTRDWRDYRIITLNQRYEEGAYENQLMTYENTNSFTKPTTEDLIGAAKGIARLQNTYALATNELANGTILSKKVSTEMKSSDCFALGWGLMHAKDFKNAATWLLEARLRLIKEKETPNYAIRPPDHNLILENLIQAMLQSGNTKLAAWFVKEQLALNPKNVKALEVSKKIEELMTAERLKLSKHVVQEPEKKPDSLDELYEKTCRGELQQTPHEKRKLRCRYVTRGEPYCLIAPFKMEEYSLDPFVAVYYDVIYDSEIENIFAVVTKNVKRSQVGGTHGFVSDVRTSKNTWLFYHEHPFLNNIAWRLTHITGLSLASAEALQVANYGIGGHYGPHYDFFEDGNADFQNRGERILTALFYINEVEFGGATAFPYLKVLVPPVERSLVVWYNLHRSGEYDYRMKHAGCPVIKGSKWICNEWFHETGQEFYRPCDLKPEGHISIQFSDKNMWEQ